MIKGDLIFFIKTLLNTRKIKKVIGAYRKLVSYSAKIFVGKCLVTHKKSKLGLG